MSGSRIVTGLIILSIPLVLAPALLAPGAAVMKGRPQASLDGEVIAEGTPGFGSLVGWPGPLPNGWTLGQVTGLAVDGRDHLWLVHRHRTSSAGNDAAISAAPPVVELDPLGRFVRAWGGPGAGYEWPESPHTIHVDADGHVWIAGNGPDDHQILKFAADGRFLLQIGGRARTAGNGDTRSLGQPAAMDSDPEADELYVADGYRNRRIIVFDATTGAYRRHWGAYGERPTDTPPSAYDPSAPLPRQFGTPVHAVRLSRDGLVYVADRAHDRIQVFRRTGEFVAEATIAPQTRGMGSVWDLAFSHDPAQRYVYVADGENRSVWILSRADLRVVGALPKGRHGAGGFGWVHALAVDSRGSIHTADVDDDQRMRKFVHTGPPISPDSTQ